jgi:arginine exporter protein ArgO
VRAAVLAGLLAGYGIAVPVGAVAAYLLTLSARAGLRVGLSAAFGVASVDGGYALLAALGGTAVAERVAPVAGPLRKLSVLVLLLLAARTAVAATRAYRAREQPTGPGPEDVRPATACATLAAATAVNPATVVYFAALVGARAGTPASLPERVIFAAAAFAASASWQLLLAGGGALLGRALTGARARLATALTSSALIAVLALRLA